MGDVLHVECDFAAINGHRVTGATRSNVTARIMIDGMERGSSRDYIFHGKKVRLASTTEIALIGDSFVEAAFSGTFHKTRRRIGLLRSRLLELIRSNHGEENQNQR